ncbi:hypothetical protein AB0H00_21735 [Nocardia sp. NPDC023852]|uniref:hypothetical protein n=1 Tax=Nocardia sp. NPDC023852 TaxID=3154697 RepID=UPI0033CF8871
MATYAKWAWRAGSEEQAWRLNWCTPRLTREQARAAMNLSGLLSAFGSATDPSAHECADAQGITLQHASIALPQRMHDRRHS